MRKRRIRNRERGRKRKRRNCEKRKKNVIMRDKERIANEIPEHDRKENEAEG